MTRLKAQFAVAPVRLGPGMGSREDVAERAIAEATGRLPGGRAAVQTVAAKVMAIAAVGYGSRATRTGRPVVMLDVKPVKDYQRGEHVAAARKGTTIPVALVTVDGRDAKSIEYGRGGKPGQWVLNVAARAAASARVTFTARGRRP